MSKRYSADREVAEKSEVEIERETAQRWAARAIACYRQYDSTGGEIKWLLRAEQARHEALEHAADAEDGGKLVGELGRRIAMVRPKGLR